MKNAVVGRAIKVNPFLHVVEPLWKRPIKGALYGFVGCAILGAGAHLVVGGALIGLPIAALTGGLAFGVSAGVTIGAAAGLIGTFTRLVGVGKNSLRDIISTNLALDTDMKVRERRESNRVLESAKVGASIPLKSSGMGVVNNFLCKLREGRDGATAADSAAYSVSSVSSLSSLTPLTSTTDPRKNVDNTNVSREGLLAKIIETTGNGFANPNDAKLSAKEELLKKRMAILRRTAEKSNNSRPVGPVNKIGNLVANVAFTDQEKPAALVLNDSLTVAREAILQAKESGIPVLPTVGGRATPMRASSPN